MSFGVFERHGYASMRFHETSNFFGLSPRTGVRKMQVLSARRFRAMGIELYPKFLSLTETRWYQPFRGAIVAECCQTTKPPAFNLSGEKLIGSKCNPR